MVKFTVFIIMLTNFIQKKMIKLAHKQYKSVYKLIFNKTHTDHTKITVFDFKHKILLTRVT